MKPAPFRYARPTSLDEVISLLAGARGEAKLLAGGQSLLPLLNMRFLRPAILIDLALVAELQVLERDGDELVIGAGVPQRTVETSPIVRSECALIPLALRYVGYVQTRSRGTIGGSLAHADPAGELPGVAVALDATLVAAGPGGRRVIPATEFFRGAFQTALNSDEVLTELRVPIAGSLRYGFREAARRSVGAAIAGVAAAVHVGDNGNVAQARFAAIGVSATPLRLASAEDAARDSNLAPADRARIGAAAVDDVERLNGSGADAYRPRLVATLVDRALAEVAT
jgi:aerobic carbon-monoxide dehydrogenase medium subunit